MDNEIELKVVEGLAEDVGKGLARLDPEDMKRINGVLGDLIEIKADDRDPHADHQGQVPGSINDCQTCRNDCGSQRDIQPWKNKYFIISYELCVSVVKSFFEAS
jgi:hypothetical protein